MSKFTLNKNKNAANAPAGVKVNYFLLVMVGLGLGMYIWQTNNLVGVGYKIKELERQSSHLRDSNKDLENKAVQLRSVQAIQDKIDRLSLVPATQVEYINPVGNVIAQK